MNQCAGQLDSISVKTQQTADYLLEIMRAFGIKNTIPSDSKRTDTLYYKK